ncbi:hypothetical protein PLICRDRAFT_54030 [Plicaturopsis crispa FD-325 SS-3]|nr:hypothetical protein PLICRDRAFT_54030 [Plicaturopsis crispa FD-325 SS-3]
MPTQQHHHQDHSLNNSMQPPPSPSIPIDPALALYSPYYPYQQQPQQPQMHQSMTLPNMSSPSSHGSGTPPTEGMSISSASRKRPSSSMANGDGNDSRKKARKDDDEDDQSPVNEQEPKAKPTRGSRACTVCRRLKMKCVGAEQGPPCKRCLAGNHECIFEESNRGKRSSKKHELLTRSLRKMEKTLDTVLRSIGNPGITSGMVSRSPSPSVQASTTQALLASPSPPPSTSSFNGSHSHSQQQQQQQQHQPQQNQHPLHYPAPGSPKLHSLPDNSLNPLGLLAEASLANRRAQQASAQGLSSSMQARPADGNATRKLGVASDLYFKPGPMTILPLRRLYIERQVQPEMLNFTSKDEVVALFDIYFNHLNMHCNLLDRDFHTPALVCSRSPFLLTTICAIASKFYTPRPELHSQLTELAKNLAFSVPAQGYKSVEIVQAYLLLSLWGCGAVERYEQDKTWLLLGMAIRMGTDLNLHRKTAVTSQDSPEGRARDMEVHNRERTWVLCFCLDRSFSAQMGKPYSIKEDFIIRNVADWYRAPSAIPGDASLAVYVDLQRILTRSLDLLYSATSTPSGLQTDCDYMLVIKTIETQILAAHHEWYHYRGLNNGGDDPATKYRQLYSDFYFNYAMLVLNSFGLQNAMERSAVDIGHFFARTHSSAAACATLVRDKLGPSGFLKYSPDSHFVIISYAVLSLLKLVRPEFQAFLEDEQATLGIVKDVADVLENVSENPHHTPALYSAFLRALISVKADPSAGEGGQQDPSQARNGDSSSAHLGEMGPPASAFHGYLNGQETDGFQFDGEIGPGVADMSTFPPTMTAAPLSDDTMGAMTMDSILSTGFWDSVLMPGYSNTLEGLSGGFVYGAGGSGLITPGLGITPIASGNNSPSRGNGSISEFSQQTINAAFSDTSPVKRDP